jgi:hypothetical protein
MLQMWKVTAALGISVALAGCGEWRVFPMVNPETKATVACATDTGTLSDELIQRLHECIQACEAHGFVLQSPERVPPLRTTVESARPPSLPIACQSPREDHGEAIQNPPPKPL